MRALDLGDAFFIDLDILVDMRKIFHRILEIGTIVLDFQETLFSRHKILGLIEIKSLGVDRLDRCRFLGAPPLLLLAGDIPFDHGQIAGRFFITRNRDVGLVELRLRGIKFAGLVKGQG